MSKTKKIVDSQEYEVTYNENITYLKRTREERKEQLKDFIYAKLKKRWMEIPKQQATLEKIHLKELLNSI